MKLQNPNLMIEKTDKMEKVLKNVARVLASNTNYATMVSVPQYSGNKLKFIQLSRVNELQLGSCGCLRRKCHP